VIRRTAPNELHRLALAALASALESGGVHATDVDDGGPDLVVQLPGGERIPAVVKAASRVDPMQARRLADAKPGSGVLVVVADELTHGAQRALRAEGIGFLDRRGHLYLRSAGLHLDLDVPADPRPSTRRVGVDPIRGAAGITVAAALLLEPADALGVRDLARRTGLPVSTTSKALAPIRDAALLDGGQALIPDLFWALADVWSPPRTPVAQRPPPGTGILTGTVAAAELGAPVAVAADSPPDLYVADAAEVRALERRLGTTSGPSRQASVAVQPTPLVLETATRDVAHPLFIALDLSQDRARGREILDAWNPTEVRRVW
jgi:hypothetical protein